MLALLLVLLLPALGWGQDVSTVGATTPFNMAAAINAGTYCNVTDTASDYACVNSAFVAAGAARPANDGQAHVYFPAGTYYMTNDYIFAQGSRWHFKCEDPTTTIFKLVGTERLFTIQTSLGTEPGPHTDVSVENCGFDAGGWDLAGNDTTFFTFISFTDVDHVTIRDNVMVDALLHNKMCRLYGDCQKQYILILGGDDILIERNTLRNGGRIKAGRPGNRLLIQDNTLHNINDNGITVVDTMFAAGSSNYIIRRNVITHPIHSGIFIGVDGEESGALDKLYSDITVVDNVVLGDWEQTCFTAMLPNMADNIFVARNLCIKHGKQGPFASGFTVERTANAVLAATDITLYQNVVARYPDGQFGGNAYRFTGLYADLCVLGSQGVGLTGTGMQWRPNTGHGIDLGTDLHGAATSYQTGADVTTSGSYASCFVPSGESLGTGGWTSVTVTSPTTSATYTTSTNPIAISGTASSGVTEVTWLCYPDCGSGTATGTTSWSIPVLKLVGQVNFVLIKALDTTTGHVGWGSLFVTYTPPTTESNTIAQFTMP